MLPPQVHVHSWGSDVHHAWWMECPYHKWGHYSNKKCTSELTPSFSVRHMRQVLVSPGCSSSSSEHNTGVGTVFERVDQARGISGWALIEDIGLGCSRSVLFPYSASETKDGDESMNNSFCYIVCNLFLPLREGHHLFYLRLSYLAA